MNDGKQCSKCTTWKPYSDFPKDRTKRDGYDSRCKACRLAQDMNRAGSVPTPTEKACLGCHEVKPAMAFSKNRRFPDGLQKRCKACVKTMHADHYQRNSVQIRGKVRDWRLANLDRKRATDASYRLQNKPRITAKQRERWAKHQDRLRQQKRDHYAANRDAMLRRFRELYWADPIAARAKRRKYHHNERQDPQRYAIRVAKRRAYYVANKARLDAYKRDYVARNRPRYRAIKSAYKARRRKAPGRYTGYEWETLCNWFGNVCLRCGSSAPLTVDHVMPLNMGGANDITNLQPLCASCNSSKRDTLVDYRDPERFAAFLQHLLLAIE